MREAAEIVRQETRLTAVSTISREIARRVTVDLTSFIEHDADDPMAAAIDRVRLSLNPYPFHILATDPTIDSLALFLAQRIENLISRAGAYLSPSNVVLEQRQIQSEIFVLLTGRY